MKHVGGDNSWMVDVRLYLNKEWAKDKRRRKKCGIPSEIRFRTRHALALEMLAEHRATLPHAWIAGDDEMGRSSAFRRDLRALEEQYLLAVPSNTLVRDLEAQAPEYRGRGPRPQVPFMRVDRWREALAEDAWTTIDVRDGARGPLVVQAVKTQVQAKTDRRRNGPEETLVVLREKQGDGTMKHDYYLSNALPETVRTIIAALLCRALDCGSPAYIRRHNTRRLQRNERAYAYHWKSHNRLPPLRFNQRK